MTDHRIRNALLLYGLDDMLQLWWIAGTVHSLTGIPRDTPELIDPTLNAIRDLLEAGYAYVGDAVQDEKGLASVRAWDLSPKEAEAKIRERWSELDQPLNIGDVAWLELTETGRQEAERLDAAGCDPFSS